MQGFVPRVSVVVPAYNPGLFLHEALESVLAQTFPAWELVVVDDGSTQDLAWVDGLDPRIRLLKQPNAGVAAARNRGCDATTGPLLAYLDADDSWASDKLARQLPAFENQRVALASTGFTIVDGQGNHLMPGYDGNAESYHDLLQGNGVCTSTVMVRRSAIVECGGFDPSLVQAQDWDLWLRIARRHDVVKVNDPLARYRIHDLNSSRDYISLNRSSKRVLDKQRRAAMDEGTRQDLPLIRIGRRRVGHLAGAQAFDLARAAIRQHPLSGVRHLLNAMRLAPGFVLRELASKASAPLRRR